MDSSQVGSTRTFVLAKGFTQVGSYTALIGEDDTRRLFAEVYADPDRPSVRPGGVSGNVVFDPARLDAAPPAIVLA